MDRIILNAEQVNKLLEWRDKHKEQVRQHKTIITDGEIYVEDTKKSMFFKVDYPFIDFNVPQGFKARIENIEGKGYRIVTASIEDHGLISDTLALYFAVTAFIYYFKPEIKTRLYTYKETIAVTKRKRVKGTSIKTVTIKGVIYRLPADIKPNRRPPKRITESWSVRGHARHLASGKVIYVKPYTKGKGKVTDKAYRIKP